MDLTELKEKHPELVEQIIEEVRAAAQEESQRDEDALRQEIDALLAENDKIAGFVRRLGFGMYLERRLSGNPDADLVLEFVGDTSGFASPKELKEKVEKVLGVLERHRSKDEARRLAECGVDPEMIDELMEDMNKALELNEELALRVHAHQRLLCNPRAAKVLRAVETAKCRTTEDIDRLIDEVGGSTEYPLDEDHAQNIRARVRGFTRGGYERLDVDEAEQRLRSRARAAGSDIPSIDDFRTLSGLPDKH
jgi:hypothetical protein